MRFLVKIFKALSDPNRLRIVKMLQKQALCVCEITAILQLSASTVSKHLSILRDAGLILDSKDGKWVNYRLTDSPENNYVQELLPLLERWLEDDQTVQADAAKVKTTDRLEICSS